MTDTSTAPHRRPIGFWLKLVDRLIGERLDATLAPHGLTRRHWQILNVIHRGASTVTAIDDQLRPFLDEVRTTVAPLIDELSDDGWLRPGTDLAMTDDATVRFLQLLDDVTRDRERLASGIDQAEYRTVLVVLERMARNLGWTSDT